MTRLSPRFQVRWREDEDGILVPDGSPLPPGSHWWVTQYAQVGDWTLVSWELHGIGVAEAINGETLYFRDAPIAQAGGALDLYAPSEFENRERDQRQDADGRLARNVASTVWNRVNRTQNAYGCPNAIALALRSPENIRQVRLELP